VNLGLNGEFGGIAAAQLFGEGRGLALFDQIDGAAAKAAACEPRADEAGQILGQGYHGVGFDATAFEVLAVTPVRLGHEAAEFGEIALCQSIGGGHCAQVFADDMAGAEKRFGRHLVAPFFEIVDRDGC
jgi:hypothetical protein